MQVTVKTLDSETRVFTVTDEATVEEFKKQIASDVGIPAERQRLIFKGKVLQDSLKLESYGVDGCVVHLVERRPPTQRTHPDGASNERSSSDSGHAGDGHGPGFNLPTDVMNISQQIVHGLVSQLGLNSAQANVSTSQSGDGSTLNVHINLLASANAANDASVRIARARQFLRAARTSLNRSEGDGSVLNVPESSENMDTSSPTTHSQPNTSTSSQQTESQTNNNNQNNSPDVLADVLGELLELNTTMQPYIQRYITLLNSNNTESLLPSDDILPDRVAESLHNLSHAYHALSDLTFNFRAPEPRQLNVLPSLSNHVGAPPFLSSLFSGGPGGQPAMPQQGQQMPPTNADASIHVVPGGSAIAFTSIISGSLPPSGIYSQQPSTTTMGGANRTITLNPSLFSVDFGSHGNPQRTPGSNASTNTSSTTSTSTSTQSSTQGGGGGDNVRIVMDDIVALFSNAHPVTSHSETSRTATATPSQQHSQGGTDTQTQNSGTTGTARAVPRINIGSMPLHGNHQDPSVPCESFHFGPRSRQPQVAQPEGNAASQPNLANGLAQAFSDAVASALQDTMTGRTGSGNRTDQATPGTTPQTGNTTTSSTTSSTGTSAQTSSTSMVNPLVQVLSMMQNIEEPVTTGQSTPSQTPAQQRSTSAGTREIEMLQNAIMTTIGQAVRGEENQPPQTIRDFLNEVDEAIGGTNEGPTLEGPLLNRLIDRFGRTLSMQDLIFMLMGMPEPYSRLRVVVRQYLLNDLLNGRPVTDENIQDVTSQITSELLAAAGDLLAVVPAAEGVDVQASVSSFLEDVIKTALTMSRDLDDASFAARFPEHVKQSTTDLCILLAMCFREGVRGATNFVGIRLPESMTRDINPFMLQTFQATAVQYVESANRRRPQREEILKRHVKPLKPQDDTPEQTQSEACEVSSQRSDDSDAFATPPLSMSANDNEEDSLLDKEDEPMNAMEIEEGDEEQWKTVVPEDWVPIIARDVIRQRRLPQQAPFSDAYLSGLPPKRRKTADQRAVCSTSENMPSVLRQAVLAAGVTPRTSMEALTSDARKSSNLHQAYRDEVHKAVKNRTSKDEDYTPDRFPSTKDYIEKS